MNCSSNPQPPPLTAEEKAILESDKIGMHRVYFIELSFPDI